MLELAAPASLAPIRLDQVSNDAEIVKSNTQTHKMLVC